MKIKLLCVLSFTFFLSSIFCNAQITITNANMPSSSDTIRYSNTSFVGLNYDTTGANITWDFSMVTPLSQGLYEYKPSLLINPTYSLFFGLSSYGLKILDSLTLGTFTISNVYDFYKNNSTSFRAVGRGLEYTGFAIPSNYSDDDEIYQFPLDYTNYDSSTYAVSFTLSTLLSLSQSGYRINEVDGYGTVITPYGTFSCLKVKTTLVETDSLTINGIALPPVTRTTRQNKWLSTAEKIPVFEVDGNVLFGSFVPTYARYRDNYLIPAGIDGVTYTEPGMVIYPNPTSSSLTVCLPSAQNGSAEFDNYDELIITDATGKTVYQKEFLNLGHSCSDGNRYQSIQTSNLPSGIYFLRLRTPDGFYSSKFIKE